MDDGCQHNTLRGGYLGLPPLIYRQLIQNRNNNLSSFDISAIEEMS